MRFGPPPRMMTFLRVGRARLRSPACRSRPRRSSTCRACRRRIRPRRCRCACRPAARRACARSAATSASFTPAMRRPGACRRSRAPSAGAARPRVFGRPSRRTSFSAATIFSTSRRNHGSNLQASWISSSETPARIACAAISTRSGVGVASAAWKACADAIARHRRLRRGPTARSPARAGPSAAPRRRTAPIAIVSPTDFIEVVSVAGVPGNFSKVKRGIFTTT